MTTAERPPTAGRRANPRVRLAGVGSNIFTEMSALAVRYQAVNLAQGFPDAPGPSSVTDSAVRALHAGHHQYPPVPGLPSLRTAIADHQRDRYGIVLAPETEVVVTTGASEAIAAALLAFAGPGDEILTLEPYYDSYAAGAELAGARLVPVPLPGPDFRLAPELLRAAVTDRTRVLLLNNPHNPTGTVLNERELTEVARVAIDHDLVVISDEVYEHLVYDGRHRPIAMLPGMFERTVTIGSAGKTFSFTGWKVGWATGPADLVAGVLAVKQYLSFASGTPFQHAVADALRLPERHYTDLRDSLRARRDLLVEGLSALGLRPRAPEGTYFVLADVRALGAADGLEFCRELPRRYGVAAIPAQVFYADPQAGRHLVRFVFCKQENVLREALRRLAPLRTAG
ncbi:hypothetical protein SGFS_031370 [Streptomyces graminofaciens]|uniref:Aminotransferase class I/classII large domain-containing protein n=1 Tax=Streptomyces graminofaciens TaxID=68212 RepID=A0ABN5VHR1_9ACTN|nr:aminotransferase class I/II-fold pyridoxal phosphate-dependent enzyme [Streptomyces graminofaciens]BBC31843.1 hypothetical protein SGFS_031370 [Streptomyces graminofaciens]